MELLQQKEDTLSQVVSDRCASPLSLSCVPVCALCASLYECELCLECSCVCVCVCLSFSLCVCVLEVWDCLNLCVVVVGGGKKGTV